MKAIIYNNYGPANVLKYQDIQKPVNKANEVLIKINATSVTPMDWKFRSGNVFLARVMSGIFKPKNNILGIEYSGTIEKVGDEVTSFKIGDLVYGVSQGGGYAEYMCVPENYIDYLPKNISLRNAGTVPFGATTAFHFLVDKGKISKGDTVLINGASGGVGIFAVQLAKYYGAKVIAVCSGKNVDLVKSLGADIVIDYTISNFINEKYEFDIIFDVVGNSSFKKCKKLLKQNGRYYTTILSFGILGQMLKTKFQKQYTAQFSLPPFPPINILHEISRIIEEGKLITHIGKEYTLEDVISAHEYAEKGHAVGKTLVVIEK